MTVGTAAASPAPACPATGLWARCSIVYRLESAGLAPRVDSSAAQVVKPLTPPGILIHVGRGEMDVYLYPDAASREREQASIEKSRYVSYPAPAPMTPTPTLISSVNVIVMLHSKNEQLRERVSDLITAGPPQPPSKKP